MGRLDAQRRTVLTRKRRIVALVVTLGLVALGSAVGAIAVAGSGTPAPPSDTHPRAGQTPALRASQIVSGQQWSLSTFTNSQGDTCASVVVPADLGEGGTGVTCVIPGLMYKGGALRVDGGGRTAPSTPTHWANAWVFGWAAPSIDQVKLQLRNCAEIRLPISKARTFFHVFGANAAALPQRVYAYDSNGSITDTQVVRLPEVPKAPLAAPNSCS
jgi:hypothetical protein